MLLASIPRGGSSVSQEAGVLFSNILIVIGLWSAAGAGISVTPGGQAGPDGIGNALVVFNFVSSLATNAIETIVGRSAIASGSVATISVDDKSGRALDGDVG
jgi:hypothetical protein